MREARAVARIAPQDREAIVAGDDPDREAAAAGGLERPPRGCCTGGRREPPGVRDQATAAPGGPAITPDPALS